MSALFLPQRKRADTEVCPYGVRTSHQADHIVWKHGVSDILCELRSVHKYRIFVIHAAGGRRSWAASRCSI